MNRYTLTLHKDGGVVCGISGYADSVKKFLDDFAPMVVDSSICQITLTRSPRVLDNVTNFEHAAIKRAIKDGFRITEV